jgi:hypothetical protein
MAKAQEKGVKIHFPVDYVTGDDLKKPTKVRNINLP